MSISNFTESNDLWLPFIKLFVQHLKIDLYLIINSYSTPVIQEAAEQGIQGSFVLKFTQIQLSEQSFTTIC